MKKLVIGILAHVDAGKTTLSEGMLYKSGSIRKMGRVDKGDAFLDTYELEKARGITIFSKQAVFNLENTHVTLLDTPGHVDFSAEMERTLQVLDYAILVISGADGIQGHTQTLWRLLSKYKIPVFLFVNKMDQNGTNKESLLLEIKNRLDTGCMDFTHNPIEKQGLDVECEAFYESLAMCEDELLDRFLETGLIESVDIQRLILERKVFPCFFGSALKLEGLEAFLQGLDEYTSNLTYPEVFGAKVFKISRDDQGNRLTYMKITGGNLKVKALLTDQDEKVNQIRIYSGIKYTNVDEIEAGCICAVTGLSKTYPGQGIGIEAASSMPLLEPVLTYKIELPLGYDAPTMLPKLRQLEEEEPQLHIVWDDTLQEIQAQLMGEVQTEILKSLILERFGVEVEFGTGNIVYKETIENIVEGVGHFEPLRHYAEVHLLLSPGERGSGLQFAENCSEDILDRNWQRLILTHLEEKEHKGVLTGAAITDMKITLVLGRAHQKHTEGGDFRQATYRAVRQGLKQAKSVLLEPYYEFRLEIQENMVGRAMSDMEKMNGTFEITQLKEGIAVLSGIAPVVTMRDYQKEVIAYTRGFGRLSCSLKGYEPCHNVEEIIDQLDYDSERDSEDPTGSVFCAHGAGFAVTWDHVKDYMHMPRVLVEEKEEEKAEDDNANAHRSQRFVMDDFIDEEEINQIFKETFFANKRDKSVLRKGVVRRTVQTSVVYPTRPYKKPEPREEYLLVDGYNIIHAWPDLKELAQVSMDGARGKLLDILCNYQGMKKCNLIVVFDAYRLKDHETEMIDYHNIHVVYTREAETADQYIERFAYKNSEQLQITVATSDGMEQIIIRGKDCQLYSARELKEEIKRLSEQRLDEFKNKQTKERDYLLDTLSEEEAARLRNMISEDDS